MPVIRFTDQVLIQLHDKVMEKYAIYCRKKGHDPTFFKVFEKYGYEDSSNPSLMDALMDDPKSGEFIREKKLNLNPSYFYKRILEARKGRIEIGLVSEYLQVYLIFLGVDTKEDLLNRLKGLSDEEKALQLRIWKHSYDNETAESQKLTFYGGYYALEKHEIRYFTLEFSTGRDKRNSFTPSHVIKRYDTNASFLLGDKVSKYRGYTDRVGIHLYATLWLEGQSDMNVRGAYLILQQGIAELDEVPVLSGVYSAVTKKGHSVSGEALFFRTDLTDDAEHYRLKKGLDRYLFTNAKQTLITSPPVTDRTKLKYENYSQNAKALKSKTGYYQFIYLRGDKSMIISRFHLQEDYRIRFKTPFSRYSGFFRVSSSGHNFYLTLIRPDELKADYFSIFNLTVVLDFDIEGEIIYAGNILYVEQNGRHTSSKCFVRKVEDVFEPRMVSPSKISLETELFKDIYNELDRK